LEGEKQAMSETTKDLAGGPHCPDAKWAAVVDDVLVPMPQRRVPVVVLTAQAAVPDNFVLVRDHNSPDDYVLPNDGEVDLAEGNVFYRLERCSVQPRAECHAPAKLAFVVNDRFAVSTRADQTGTTLRDLFGLPAHAKLFRDLEGPTDDEIPASSAARFVDGPVFYYREVPAELKITVNSRVFTEHEGVKPEMTGLEIAALVYPENPTDTRVHLVSDGNREVPLNETLKIHGCEVFDVVRKEVTGGFESLRVDRELNELRTGGLAITFVESPGAVVYHDLRTAAGAPVALTDVLVPVPGGYPGQMIDWAYLPDNSPLIGRVKGSPQENRITALGKVWRQISYHPHNGGGGPKWNPTIHGFHTYLGELYSWLRNI
jgi:hypothetical protein